MKRVVVEHGTSHYIDLTLDEEGKVLARVKAGEEAEDKEAERRNKAVQARAKVIAKDPDLARALGWIE